MMKVTVLLPFFEIPPTLYREILKISISRWMRYLAWDLISWRLTLELFQLNVMKLNSLFWGIFKRYIVQKIGVVVSLLKHC